MPPFTYEETNMDSLVGRTIQSLEIDGNEQHYLRFKTNQGDVIYEAVGDCCSESWFYHVLGVDGLLNQRVVEIVNVEMGDAPDDGLGRQDVDSLYGIRLVTTRGYVDIEFRNSSNGYYGGWLEEVSGIPDDVKMVQVTEDYTAQASN